MSGGGSQTTQQSQNSVSSPWSAAQPLLTNLLNSYGGLNTSVTPAQTAASGQLVSDTSGIPNQGAGATSAVNNALNFNTTPQMGMLGGAFNTMSSNLAPLTNPANLNPYNTPGFSTALNTMNSDITKQVGNQYAASGRDPAGAGSQPQTLARGLSQGEGQLIANQYNTNAGNLLSANNSVFGAGNTTAQGQANLGATGAGVNLAGVSAVPGASTAYSSPGATALTAANAAQSTPWTNLAQLLTPAATIGSLGGQTSGSGTSTTTGSTSLLSNIMGGASAGIGMLSLLSDKRAKTDIQPVGKLNDGQVIHKFRMKGEPHFQIGLLAQEVQKKVPSAVGSTPMGLLNVNYDRATQRSAQMKEAA